MNRKSRRKKYDALTQSATAGVQSPKGTAAGSLGRKPQENRAAHFRAPEGRQRMVCPTVLSPLQGLGTWIRPNTWGLHPRLHAVATSWLTCVANVHCVAIVALVIALTGCGSGGGTTTTSRQSFRSTSEVDNFANAMDVLDQFDEFEPSAARKRILLNLNRWIESEKPDPDWREHELVSHLPSRYKDMPDLKDLNKLEITRQDVFYLQEATWLRDITHWVAVPQRTADFGYLIEGAKRKLDEGELVKFEREGDHLAAALSVLDPSLKSDHAMKLASCLRVFDWTIRNIQLDKMLDVPTEPTVGPVGAAAQPNIVPEGPGYQRHTWQTMMYGHGDTLERSRVFIQLARQMGIDAVMLGHTETGRTTRATPWIPGVYIDGRLFLFDPTLGLPIPGAETPIATLKEVRDKPEILKALDFNEDGEQFEYPITDKELKQLVALIDATPESMSQRMHLIEQKLVGEQKIVLTIDATRLEQEMRNRIGLNTGLWTLPFDVIVYREMLDDLIRRDARVRSVYYVREGIFAGSNQLVKARQKHFHGILEGNEQKDIVGAKRLYASARVSDEVIDLVGTEEEVREIFGLDQKPGEDSAIWQARVQQFQVFHKVTKIHAGYWLAICHYELGNFPDATNWLKRADDMDEQKTWRDGINYNLGRGYEAMGNWAKAIEYYEFDKSPQRHGCLLRARILKKELAADKS